MSEIRIDNRLVFAVGPRAWRDGESNELEIAGAEITFEIELFLWRQAQHVGILEILKVGSRGFVRKILKRALHEIDWSTYTRCRRHARRIDCVLRVDRNELSGIDARIHEVSELRILHAKRELKRVTVHRELRWVLHEPLLVDHCRVLTLEHFFENEEQPQPDHSENQQS